MPTPPTYSDGSSPGAAHAHSGRTHWAARTGLDACPRPRPQAGVVRGLGSRAVLRV